MSGTATTGARTCTRPADALGMLPTTEVFRRHPGILLPPAARAGNLSPPSVLGASGWQQSAECDYSAYTGTISHHHGTKEPSCLRTMHMPWAHGYAPFGHSRA